MANILFVFFASQELFLAETWARKNKLPFPDVREQARQFETEPLREVYIFRGDNCPTIMHFVLVNTSFRKFKAPGQYLPLPLLQKAESVVFLVLNVPLTVTRILNFFSARFYFRLLLLVKKVSFSTGNDESDTVLMQTKQFPEK